MFPSRYSHSDLQELKMPTLAFPYNVSPCLRIVVVLSIRVRPPRYPQVAIGFVFLIENIIREETDGNLTEKFCRHSVSQSQIVHDITINTSLLVAVVNRYCLPTYFVSNVASICRIGEDVKLEPAIIGRGERNVSVLVSVFHFIELIEIIPIVIQCLCEFINLVFAQGDVRIPERSDLRF